MTILTGDGGTNKSTCGHQIAVCRAAGLPFLGIDLEPGSTLHITAEDNFDRLHWVHNHICEAVNVDPLSLLGKVHLSSLRGRVNNQLATFDDKGRTVLEPTLQLIRATLVKTGADLLVLDNVAHFFSGNENDRVQVTAFVNLLYSLCVGLGVTVILVAHRNKAGDTYSGSTAWLNAVRSQLVIARPEGGMDPDERVMTVGKANYARPDEVLHFRWHNFALVRNEDLSPDTRAELDKAIRMNGENAAFLACLKARNSQGDGRSVGPSPGPNYAPAQFEGMAEAKGFKKDALKRAMDRLFAMGRIESVTVENKKAGRTAHILREVIEEPHNAPHNARTTPPPNPAQPSAQPRTTHTPYTTYMSGAAHGAAAPTQDEDLDWGLDGLEADQ